jgi:hypothetical protein
MPDKSDNARTAPTGPPGKDGARTQPNRKRRHSNVEMKGAIITAIAALVGALIGGMALLFGRSDNSQAAPTGPPAKDAPQTQPYPERRRQKVDRGALIARAQPLRAHSLGV